MSHMLGLFVLVAAQLQVENFVFSLENRTLGSMPLGQYACYPEVVLFVKLYERERRRRKEEGGK